MKQSGITGKQPLIELTRQQTEALSAMLKQLMEETLDTDVGQLQAALILDALLLELGPPIYNKAIQDVQEHLIQRFEIIQSDLWALEK